MIDLIKKGLNILTVLILSVGFLGSGMLCLINYPELIGSFEKWGYSKIFMYTIGILELTVAIMVFHKPWRKYGILLGIIIMFGAIFTHVKSQEYDQLYGPILVLTLLFILFLTELNLNTKSDAASN